MTSLLACEVHVVPGYAASMRDVRRNKLKEALDQRLGYVHCAVEAVYHRHNVSAILRTCDALGIHHVHLIAGGETPALAPARGAERWLDIRHYDGPEQAMNALHADGIRVYVADLDDAGVPPEHVPLTTPVCLWFGAEMVGPSPIAHSLADGVMTLPMRGLAQSLNVSVAAALSLRPVAEAARTLHGAAALLPAEQHAAIWQDWRNRAGRNRRDITGE